MTEQKNQRAILSAAREVKERPADVHFVIAGSGPLESELRAAATRLGVDDVVTFTGYLPRREHVYGLLHRSDVFLVPSLYEGFCVAAVEAMACELPVIANDIEVLREVVGDDGIFVSAEDVQGLADRIIHTASKLGTESMRNRRSALRRRAMTEFPLERTAVAYHDLYVDICG
jgi:glycosyltransferase involved in cell wall biosynthesis